ncbi:PTS sugar transporter subunit IIA [Lactobacillus kefiranofaciens]|uniref:PTS sugar transporter subunit IIA n=1 Tax=Lactobacillus kefiranofaciens TaxID=267818 RepID=A0AAX3UBX4_9LACO|nr:PTS sugar transporter subunit IIA [Lactobacillus kefiranofaciens]AEG41397.1 PTS system IIA [Lactobacillus kefiranofaciens subsp. kefiranofaciens]MCJ2172573.1 PTS sugar transporter subunit IIA [Lactobacillus kefiranofaciens]MDF4142987.1 PTS sugar transporter subunit IIA [Lactobacillus kefiranofaciens]PAK98143.1 PTS sugar transporter subunit IIA [Lactobacillus kefiranofaciens]QFQ67128.1 PTS sugar transporter subunit IIA [Lactobacillus kefiranofaciens subsp. kefiranofaciens]
MTNTRNLFTPDAVFVTDQTKQDLVLKEVYDNLLQRGYVKGNFLSHIVKREHDFPTGLDTSTLGKNIPNIAIPHTEGEFVNTRLIVPVSLREPVVFHNMIKPDEALEVKFLFMLLDNDPDGQAQLLASVMDFLAKTPANELREVFNFTDAQAIYAFLEQKFMAKIKEG